MAVRKDGSIFFADVAITAMGDSLGGVTGFCKVSRDVSERRRGNRRARFAARVRQLQVPVPGHHGPRDPHPAAYDADLLPRDRALSAPRLLTHGLHMPAWPLVRKAAGLRTHPRIRRCRARVGLRVRPGAQRPAGPAAGSGAAPSGKRCRAVLGTPPRVATGSKKICTFWHETLLSVSKP